MYLVDTNVISETRRSKVPHHRRDHPLTRKRETWLDLVVANYPDRILGFDEECAQLWDRLMSPHHEHPIDKQIAAIALIHGLAVVTRNIDDFRGTDTKLNNPFA